MLDYARLQQIYSEREPYTEEIRLNGNTIIFDDVFIRLCEEAFDTGCMQKMSEDEFELFQKFISYQDGTLAVIDDNVIALDNWFVNIIKDESNPVVSTCSS